jgi:acetyl-CoA carboxylase biotin carboxyl carrier protein
MATGSGKKSSKQIASRSTASAGGETNRNVKAGADAKDVDIVETVRGLAQVVAEHTLSELIVDLPDATITLRRGGAPAVTAMPIAAPVPAVPMMPAAHGFATMLAQGPQGSAPSAPASAAPAPDDKSHVVTSPFVGTFYRRPNPDAVAYVELNQRVDKGAVLCIIEAMKLMNEIEADVAGTIVGVLAEDGAPVEYGQPLFKIAPA